MRAHLASALASALVASVLVVGAAATPTSAQGAIDWGDPVPSGSGLTRLSDAPAEAELPVLFGFRRDQDGLEAVASAVSDPALPTYGDHLSVAELAARFGISEDHRIAFEEGVAVTGAAPEIDATGAFAAPTLTVAQLEALLGVTFGLYEYSDSSGSIEVIAPDALPDPVPPALAGVELVRGLDQFQPTGSPSPPSPPSPPPPNSVVTDFPVEGGTPIRTGTAEGCSAALDLYQPLFDGPGGFAPNQLLTAYGIDQLHDSGYRGQGARLALVESGPFRTSDLDVYRDCFGLDGWDPVFHGSQPEEDGGVEPSLDVQVLAMIAPEAERLDVFVNPLDRNWQFAPFLSAPLDVSDTGGLLPDVVSVSYALCEPEVDDDLPVVELTEQVLATGAAAGVGYYAAAGDSGSSGCYHNDGTTTTLAASYPATSEWVTSVGGTNLTLTPDNEIAEQGVWNDQVYFLPPPPSQVAGGGGGGPSVVFTRPAWQDALGVGADDARLTPDVALYADSAPGWMIYCTIPNADCTDDGWMLVGGTSAATPLMTGMAALVDQATEAQGHPGLGFAAPLLYELGRSDDAASVFSDVVQGTNDLFDVGCCTAGPGYDLASGWGSPDAVGLTEAVGGHVDPPVTTTSTTVPTTTTTKRSGPVVPPRYTG